MSPATNPPPAPAAPAKPAAAGTAPATAPAKAPAAPGAAQPAAAATAAAPAAQGKKAGGKMADMFKKVGSSMGGKTKGMPKKTRTIMIVVIVVVVAVAIAAVAMRGGSAAPKKVSTIDLATLKEWSVDLSPPEANLQEGSNTVFNIADLLGSNATGTYFISEVTATLTWKDEADARHLGRMRVNQPDVFKLEINSSLNASASSDPTGNDVNSKQGSIGPLKMTVSDSGYEYFVIGNSSALRLPDTVITSDITVMVTLINAGDWESPGFALLKWNDLGNNYTLKITVKGKVYEPEAKAPAKK